jgi:hypothetical protein
LKPSTVFIILVALAATIGFCAELVTERLLDRKLGPLLARELGLPVQLAPIEADIIDLSAHSSRLVLGDSDSPAVTATEVTVRLSWSELLKGRLRLLLAEATDVSLSPADWPDSGTPRPENYEFLEPWLPETLRAESGVFMATPGRPEPVRELTWERQGDDSVNLAWIADRGQVSFGVRARLASLPALLALDDLQLGIAISAPGTPVDASTLELGVHPAEQGGYTLRARADISGDEIRISGASAAPWQFPEVSETYLAQFRPDVFGELVRIFSPEPEREEKDLEAFMLARLPQLELPAHQGRVEIGEIRLDHEVLVDTIIDFSTEKQKLLLTSLASRGPYAQIEGTGSLAVAGGEWQLELAAALKARQASEGIAGRVIGSHWHWRSGHIQLEGKGDTPGSLLDAMQGELLLQGEHQGEARTPVEIQAVLDRQPGVFALEDVRIELGQSLIHGSVALAGGRERQLEVRLEARQLDLNFLFGDGDRAPLPGFALPDYLGLASGVEVDVRVDVSDLKMPGVNLAQADFELDRKPDGGRLRVSGTGPRGGIARVALDYETGADLNSDVVMVVNLTEMNLPDAFGQTRSLLDTRTSGNMRYTSRGAGVAEIFEAMRGTAELAIELRTDADWSRPSRPEEQLRIRGASNLVIVGDRIRGMQLSDINIDALEQDLSGNVSFVAGRSPWLTARLESDRLDVDQLLDWVPDSAEEADAAGLLPSLRKLGEVEVSFVGDTVDLLGLPLREVALTLTTEEDRLLLSDLELAFERGLAKGQASLDWEGELASFRATGSLEDVTLDDFLIHGPGVQAPPLSGEVELTGQGTSIAEIASGLRAQLELEAPAEQSGGAHRRLQLDLQGIQHGVRADIKSLVWNNTELQGRVLYQGTSPPRLEVEIDGGILDLEPWEDRDTPAIPDAGTAEGDTLIARAARTSSLFTGRLLNAPNRLLSGGIQNTPDGKYFSSERADTAFLAGRETRIRGRLAEITSREGVARDLEFDIGFADGKLQATTRAGFLNGGSAVVNLDLDTNHELSTAALTASFRDVYRQPRQVGAPRTGFIALTSRGNSQAELAAHLNGMAYLEFGRGTINYGNTALLSADVATGMFRTLIPGAGKREPELRCGITLARFTDGIGITPYGYAARTGTANLMGEVEVDLREEKLKMRFQSRSHEGVGLSLGNAFSSTVTIRGPLSNPRIAPNTAGMLFRGWAAFMTAGISMLGESMVNRALASANPCKDIREAIRKDLCNSDEPLAASPLVCPP